MRIEELVGRIVVSVGPEHSIAEAARRMMAHKVGSAVVFTEGGEPAIITERDVLRAVADGVDLDTTPVAEYMTAGAITASTSWDVAEAARTMANGGFRHLIVLDSSGEVTSVLSIRDLVPALLEAHRPS
jgi:CBS domain-containing protein